ncbi:MAG: hypothetical protein COV66_11900 [Nitrospinae bacterium CG11_big_fil_rev_8_21_14_0_20_45_15]|nr:MAG: hypothetical protein COV66_11900 [Nitrospinae bacterium CG11_big_fil_rev_8_21_14_0_20_45_15]
MDTAKSTFIFNILNGIIILFKCHKMPFKLSQYRHNKNQIHLILLHFTENIGLLKEAQGIP